MTYEQFIETLLKHQTYHVKAVSFPQSCSPKKIPEAFLTLFPAIIKILEKQAAKLCQIDQVVALFGLQTAPVAIKSTLPITSRRIINAKNPEQHLCCSLGYLISSAEKLKSIKSWERPENIIVDFTSGEIMDGNYYLTRLSYRSPGKGNLYGSLDPADLGLVWKNIAF